MLIVGTLLVFVSVLMMVNLYFAKSNQMMLQLRAEELRMARIQQRGQQMEDDEEEEEESDS